MCQSRAQGGRRCATSLEPAFTKAMKAYHDSGDVLSNEMMNKILLAGKAYTSTETGKKTIVALIDKETNKQLEGEYKDFDFPPVAEYVKPRPTTHKNWYDFMTARDYFTKNLPITALLQIALEEGKKISDDYYTRESDIREARKKHEEALKTKSLLPKEIKAKEAYSILENAIAQGEEIVAPAGFLVFKLTYDQTDYDGANDEFIGIYQSVSDAKRAAVKQIFDSVEITDSYHSSRSFKAPWGETTAINAKQWNSDRTDWFKSKSDDEILEWAKNDMSDQIEGFYTFFSSITFTITPIQVEKVGLSYLDETHLED